MENRIAKIVKGLPVLRCVFKISGEYITECFKSHYRVIRHRLTYGFDILTGKHPSEMLKRTSCFIDNTALEAKEAENLCPDYLSLTFTFPDPGLGINSQLLKG